MCYHGIRVRYYTIIMIFIIFLPFPSQKKSVASGNHSTSFCPDQFCGLQTRDKQKKLNENTRKRKLERATHLTVKTTIAYECKILGMVDS